MESITPASYSWGPGFKPEDRPRRLSWFRQLPNSDSRIEIQIMLWMFRPRSFPIDFLTAYPIIRLYIYIYIVSYLHRR
jgi:hypothetical protein